MELPLTLQAAQFFAAALLGLLFGLLYDFLRGLRRTLPRLTHLLDALYALCLILANFLYLLYVGGGEFRIFMFCGELTGACIYFAALQCAFTKLFIGFWRIVTFPLRAICRFLKKTTVSSSTMSNSCKRLIRRLMPRCTPRKSPL